MKNNVKTAPATLGDTVEALHDTLVQLSRWGCRGFDCSAQTLAILAEWDQPADDLSDCLADRPVDAPARDPVDPPGAVEGLDDILADLGDCTRCGLSAGRTHLVFGEGNPKADLMFVGEGPGFEEDRCGKPFVGPAGQLLTRIIQAMHLTRDQIYICNVVKCRPPGNRNPEPAEIAVCRPFLDRQIDAVSPKVICALGSVAAKALLDTEQPVSRLRGRFHHYKGIKVMPTYHPAYLLRQPDQKRLVWDDVKKIMALLRIPL
jgi:DNA polymerase